VCGIRREEDEPDVVVFEEFHDKRADVRGDVVEDQDLHFLLRDSPF